MAIISRLGVVLGLDSGEFNAGLGQAKTGLNNFSIGSGLAKAGVAALGLALVVTAKEALQFANEMTELAKANEMSVASVLEMSAALSTSGGKIDNTGKILSAFTNKVDEAAQGSQKTRDKFKELGISLSDLGKLSEEDLLRQTINGLSEIEDPIRRNALAFDLLGKGVRGVDLKDFNNDLQVVKGSYDKSEESFRRIEEWGNRIAKSWFDAKVAIADYIVQLADSMEKNKKTMHWQNAYSEAFYGKQETGKPASPLTPSIKPVVGRATPQSDESKKLVNEAEKVNDALRQQSLEINRQLNAIGLEQSGYEKLVIEFEKGGKYYTLRGTKQAQHLLDQQKELDQETKKFNRAKEVAKQAIALEAEQRAERESRAKDVAQIAIKQAQVYQTSVETAQLEKERLDYSTTLIGQSDTQVAKAMALFDIEKEMIKLKKDNPFMSDKELQDIKNAKVAIVESQEVNTRAANTFQAGWDKALSNYSEKLKDSAALGAEAFTTMTSSMESALDNFVSTGKLSFGDLAQSIISNLIKIQLKASMMGIFGGGGGLSDMFSGIFGGNGGVSATAGAYSIDSNPFIGMYANGGDPPVGKPSIVGERGAELFVPKTAGTIIPNNTLSSMVGNQPQVVYNGTVVQNMNAIDTQSATQFLAKNKQAVWASNMSAQRSLPMSR